METRNKYFNLQSIDRAAQRERGCFYLAEEKPASDGSDFQFITTRASAVRFLQRIFVFQKIGRTINQLVNMELKDV